MSKFSALGYWGIQADNQVWYDDPAPSVVSVSSVAPAAIVTTDGRMTIGRNVDTDRYAAAIAAGATPQQAIAAATPNRAAANTGGNVTVRGGGIIGPGIRVTPDGQTLVPIDDTGGQGVGRPRADAAPADSGSSFGKLALLALAALAAFSN